MSGRTDRGRGSFEAVEAFPLLDDGVFPNSARFPALLYRGALELPLRNPTRGAEEIVNVNGWGGVWRNGVYARHHYHSAAHEVLVVCSGMARLQLGGPAGPTLEVGRGDVLIIPAGVAHRNAGSTADFSVLGAYPPGQVPDLCYGVVGERPGADIRIARLVCPPTDPAFGARGPLMGMWGAAGGPPRTAS